ncbi:MAG: hypothetical protein LBH81_01390 [Rickettsiales bacterium]|nr:hypothetical protein [Rickettsiales bacterium]
MRNRPIPRKTDRRLACAAAAARRFSAGSGRFVAAIAIFACIFCHNIPARAARVIATMNSVPITDVDINSRMALMRLQNQPERDMDIRALSNIMDDLAKLEYAAQFKITPSKAEIEENIKSLERQMGKSPGFLKSASGDEDQLNLASAANLAWQKTVFQVYAPQVSVSKADIERELEGISAAHGLPVKITLITDGSCKDSPAKITVYEQELEPDVRMAVAGLPVNEWSKMPDGRRFMVCKREKDKGEYEKARGYAENQVIFKRALFDADQQLKSARRRAVVGIIDKKYKKALDQ